MEIKPLMLAMYADKDKSIWANVMKEYQEHFVDRAVNEKDRILTDAIRKFLGRDFDIIQEYEDFNIVRVEKNEWYQYKGKSFGYFYSGFDYSSMNTVDNSFIFQQHFKFASNPELDKTVAEVKEAKIKTTYNPNFIKGEPKEAGWYLAAVRTNDFEECYYVLQLWFNPMAQRKWWVGGGYVNNQAEVYPWQDNIVAYCKLPEYKL